MSFLPFRLEANQLSEAELIQATEEILVLVRKLEADHAPTYFNLAKVMYPLLADVYDLGKVLVTEKEAGLKIGYYGYSIERLIEDVQSKIKKENPDGYSKDSMYMLSQEIQKKVQQKQDPAIFNVC